MHTNSFACVMSVKHFLHVPFVERAPHELFKESGEASFLVHVFPPLFPHVSSTTTGIITCSIHAFIQVFLVDAAIGAVLVAATYIRQGHGRLFAVVSEA